MIKIKFISIIALTFTFLISCDGDHKDPKATGRYESINSGTFTCYVDEAVWDLMQPVFKMYDSAYSEINPKFIKTNSRNAMAQLLATNADAIITPRDYLKDEDSLMKVYKVDRHQRAIFAIDGLVFFVQKNFPIDTLNQDQLLQYFTKNDVKFKSFYEKLETEPTFVCNSYLSSEFANLNTLVAKNKLVIKKIKLLDSIQAVIDFVKNNLNSIGIAYLSNIVNQENFKLLRIGFTDTSGKRIFPKYPVHQANIVRGLYPFKVNHYVYILRLQRDRVFWFAKFLETEFIVQSYFNKYGIVPAYAKIKLIENE